MWGKLCLGGSFQVEMLLAYTNVSRHEWPREYLAVASRLEVEFLYARPRYIARWGAAPGQKLLIRVGSRNRCANRITPKVPEAAEKKKPRKCPAAHLDLPAAAIADLSKGYSLRPTSG